MLTSLQVRLTILCIALATIPLSFVGVLLAWQSYQLQQHSALEFERQVTQRATLQVSTFITNVVEKLDLALQTSEIGNASPSEQQQLLSEIILDTQAFDELALLDSMGQEEVRVGLSTIFAKADLRNRSSEEAIANALSSGHPYYSMISISETSNEPLMPIAVPILDVRTGTVRGVAGGAIRLKPIWDIVASIQFGEQGTVAITDSNGRVVAHRNPSMVLRGTIVNDLAGEGVYAGIAGGEVVRTITTFSVGNQELYAIAELPLSEALGPAYQTLLTTSAILLATVLIAAGTGFVAVRQVVRPIQGLAAAARAISAGDLSRDVIVPGRDELSDLAKAFNTMTSRLRHLLADLEERVADRTAALESALSEVRNRAAEQERLLTENSRQRETIRGLSVPVLPISSRTLVMPLVGELDGTRLQMVQEQALQALERSLARYLVIDITGVPIIDSQVAQGLMAVVQAARLLGGNVLLVGIRPEVAQTLVSLGIDLQSVQTSSDLQTALRHIR